MPLKLVGRKHFCRNGGEGRAVHRVTYTVCRRQTHRSFHLYIITANAYNEAHF